MDTAKTGRGRGRGSRGTRGRGRGRGRGRAKKVVHVESSDEDTQETIDESTAEDELKQTVESPPPPEEPAMEVIPDEPEPILPPTIDMEADISQLEAPTFTTIQRGPPEPMLRLKWDHKVSLIGEKVLNPLIHCCDQCLKPILIYGRMIPCKHVFCLKCARSEPVKCPRCKEKVCRVEQSGLGSVFMCAHGGTRYGNAGCRRTYLSQRDLQAHINHRHVDNTPKQQPVIIDQTKSTVPQPVPPPRKQLDSQNALTGIRTNSLSDSQSLPQSMGTQPTNPQSELGSNYYNASPYSSSAFSSPPFGSMSSQSKSINTPPTHQLSNLGISRSSTNSSQPNSLFYNQTQHFTPQTFNPLQAHYNYGSNTGNNVPGAIPGNANNSGNQTAQSWNQQQYYR